MPGSLEGEHNGRQRRQSEGWDCQRRPCVTRCLRAGAGCTGGRSDVGEWVGTNPREIACPWTTVAASKAPAMTTAPGSSRPHGNRHPASESSRTGRFSCQPRERVGSGAPTTVPVCGRTRRTQPQDARHRRHVRPERTQSAATPHGSASLPIRFTTDSPNGRQYARPNGRRQRHPRGHLRSQIGVDIRCGRNLGTTLGTRPLIGEHCGR